MERGAHSFDQHISALDREEPFSKRINRQPLQPGEWHFLKEVERLAKFDPVLKEHVRLITSGDNFTTYLGKTIQNDLIGCIGGVLGNIVTEISK